MQLDRWLEIVVSFLVAFVVWGLFRNWLMAKRNTARYLVVRRVLAGDDWPPDPPPPPRPVRPSIPGPHPGEIRGLSRKRDYPPVNVTLPPPPPPEPLFYRGGPKEPIVFKGAMTLSPIQYVPKLHGNTPIDLGNPRLRD